jgi:hypothetical protein
MFGASTQDAACKAVVRTLGSRERAHRWVDQNRRRAQLSLHKVRWLSSQLKIEVRSDWSKMIPLGVR